MDAHPFVASRKPKTEMTLRSHLNFKVVKWDLDYIYAVFCVAVKFKTL